MQIVEDYTSTDLDDMSVAKNYNKWIIDLCKPYIGSKILEVGAGTGNFTESLLEHTHSEIFSVEPMKTPSELWEMKYQKWNIDYKNRSQLINTFVQDIPLDTSIDTVIYNNVLEHIQHDIEEIRQAKKFLKPGGYFIIYSPALPALMSKFDRSIGHYHRYTKASIISKMQKAGLEVSFLKYVDLPGVFLWYIKFVLLKSRRLGPASVRIFDSFIVPIQRRIEALFNIPFGKNILCVARKYQNS